MWVRANMVSSADGAGTLRGRSGGLSGAADQLVFSVLRSMADVILVGAGTARAEHYGQVRASEAWPQLREGRSATPPIAVATRRLDLDLDGPLLAAGAGLAPTIVITTEAAPADRRAAAARTAQVVIAGAQAVSASAVIASLAAAGHRLILVEGGPTLLGQLVAANLLDELCLTISPLMEGGLAGRIILPPGHADPRDAPGWLASTGAAAATGVPAVPGAAVPGAVARAAAVPGAVAPAAASMPIGSGGSHVASVTNVVSRFDDPDLTGSDAGNAEAGNAEAGNAEAGNAEAGNAEAGPCEAGPCEAGPCEAGTAVTATVPGNSVASGASIVPGGVGGWTGPEPIGLELVSVVQDGWYLLLRYVREQSRPT